MNRVEAADKRHGDGARKTITDDAERAATRFNSVRARISELQEKRRRSESEDVELRLLELEEDQLTASAKTMSKVLKRLK